MGDEVVGYEIGREQSCAKSAPILERETSGAARLGRSPRLGHSPAVLRALAPLIALLGLLLLVDPTRVCAQSPSAGADQEARSLFDAGSTAFAEGRYENALDYFRRAYSLSRRPQLLFNIGAAAERLRRDDEALEALREFLVQVPDSDQRAAVEARIEILERAVAERAASEAPPTQDVPAESDAIVAMVPSPEPAARDTTGPIVLMVSGGVAALTGGVLLGVAVGDVAAVENPEQGTRWSSVSDAYSRSEPLSIVGGVALGVGVAAAAGGLIWLAIPAEQSASQSASIEVVPGLGTVVVRGRF